MVSTPGYIPGPLVIPNTVEVILDWIMPNGRHASNVLHADKFGALTVNEPLATTVFDAIAADARTTAYLARLSSLASLFSVKMRDLDVALSPLVQSTSAAEPGTGTGDALPDGVALVVTLKTDVAGPTGRGRTYLMGFLAAMADTQGHAISGLTADAQAFMQGVSDAMAASSLTLAVGNRGHASYVSPRTGATIAAEAAHNTLVSSIVVADNVFDSQRRRK